MEEIVQMLIQVRTDLKTIIGLLDDKKVKESFMALHQRMPLIQQYILFLLNMEILTAESVNQISGFLLQAMEQEDAILLRDVLKYALLDVTNQLLNSSEEEKE